MHDVRLEIHLNKMNMCNTLISKNLGKTFLQKIYLQVAFHVMLKQLFKDVYGV